MVEDDIQVSVCCLTYNHEEYIRKALDGFLMQKTNFSYEIIIHDDASTDGTIDILKEYQLKYPETIKLLLEDENQWTQYGLDVVRKLLYLQARGKYIAFCEGDDFWIYDGKLQEQFDLMESHIEMSACYHNAIIWEQNEDNIRLNIMNHPSGYINDEDVICTTRGWYPTASLFTRTEYIKEQPMFPISTGDEVCRNYLACRGKLYFINRAWSVYRNFSNGGWNTRYYGDKALAQGHFKDTVLYFREFNQYSQGRFEKYIKERLFQGIIKYRNAHYGTKCSVNELKECICDLKNVTGHMIDFVLDEYYAVNVIECGDYYQTTIEKQLREVNELYIYGAGTEAMKALIELDKRHIIPKGFIVSSREGWTSQLLGIPVYGVKELVFNENMQIWPCLINGREDVLKTLLEKKCSQIIL